jgi:hypothetical protein
VALQQAQRQGRTMRRARFTGAEYVGAAGKVQSAKYKSDGGHFAARAAAL